MRNLLAGLNEDAADTPFDLWCRQSLLIGRQFDGTVGDGHNALMHFWCRLRFSVIDAGLVLVAQQGSQQGVAHHNNLVARKDAVENFDLTAFSQTQFHPSVLVLARHPLDQQVVASAAANHRVDRADDRLPGDLDGDTYPAEHAGPEFPIGVVDSNDHRLGSRLRVHCHPQVVDLAVEYLTGKRGEACLDLLTIGQQSNVGLQHFADDPERRGIDHVVQMIRGTYHLPDADVGMRDDAANRADDWHVGEQFALLLDSL